MPVGVKTNGNILDQNIMAYNVAMDNENPGTYYMYTINRVGGNAALKLVAPNIVTEL
jgi:hypothetical protein